MPLELSDLADVISDSIRREVEPLRAQLAFTEERAATEIAALKSELALLKSAVPDAFRLRTIIVDMAAEEVAKIAPVHSLASDPAELEAIVARAVAALPKPQDGKSLTADDVAPLIADEVRKAIETIPVPKDAVSLIGALIDRNNHLILTLSDGSTKDVGDVVGRAGKDVEIGDVFNFVKQELDSWPKPKDGADGFGFDDLILEHDGEQVVTFTFVRGDQVKSFPIVFPVMVWKDKFDPTYEYKRGHTVAWGGSMWTANKSVYGIEPGTLPSKDVWSLSCMRGRQGKQGDKGDPGIQGKQGPMGPQGRSGY